MKIYNITLFSGLFSRSSVPECCRFSILLRIFTTLPPPGLSQPVYRQPAAGHTICGRPAIRCGSCRLSYFILYTAPWSCQHNIVSACTGKLRPASSGRIRCGLCRLKGGGSRQDQLFYKLFNSLVNKSLVSQIRNCYVTLSSVVFVVF